MTFAGQTKPMTRWQSGFKDNDPAGRNKAFRITHLYNQQLHETQRASDQGGADSLDDWLVRGPFFAFRFDRDATSRETELNLQGYSDPKTGVAFDQNSKIFVVARYRTVRQLTVVDGQIVSVVGIES